MKHVAIVAALFAIAFLLVRDKIASTPYGYDEADYMFAASLGVRPNWFDAGTVPIQEFVRIGLQRGGDPNQRSALSAIVRGADDPVAYRHWHGPLYYYWLALLAQLKMNEHTVRFLCLLFPALTALAMYSGSALILGGTEGQVAGILSSALFLWSPVTLKTTELAPHLLFVLCCTGTLLLLAKVSLAGGRPYFYGAAACAGLAFSTMEVAFVPIILLLIFAWRYRESLATGWVLARNSLGFFLTAILAAWPAGLLKLSFLKAYMVMLYLAVFRKAAWGDVTFWQTWARRFMISPAEWLLLACALVLLAVAGSRRARSGALTFLLFAVVMVLVTIKVYATAPRYMTPFFPALELFTAWMIAPALARLRRSVLIYGSVAIICSLLVWNSHHQMSGYLLQEDGRPAAGLIALRENGLANGRILAPRLELPTLHYYFPRMRIEGYVDTSSIGDEKSDARFDAILYPDYSLKIE